MKLEQPLHFFLGANSPSGFVSFSEAYTSTAESGRLFILKGGPGTGKSTLMHTAAAVLSEREPGFEYIHCTTDPDSLDGILFPRSGIAMTDATAPHVIEPRHPGICETTVNLCSCWDEELLQSRRGDILPLFQKTAGYQQQCVRFLNAAYALLSDNENIALNACDPHKIAKTAANIIGRECHRLRQKGEEKFRLLSAVTPKGIFGFTETAAAFPRIYLLRDPYGASSGLLLNVIRTLLLEYGYSFYTCFNQLSPFDHIDHILIPDLGLAFLTESRAFPAEKLPPPYRVISFSRFTDLEELVRRRQRLRFNRRAADEILDSAVKAMRRAKIFHDALEARYAEAIDFSAVQALAARTVETALRRQEQILSE